jgi:tetratricopeptide (TPR) repeat protein
LDTLEYIDQYFTSVPSAEHKTAFESKITSDPAFAEEVAFYLTAKQLSKEQQQTSQKERFKELYRQYQQNNSNTAPRKTFLQKSWPYLAAAAIITAIVFGINVFFSAGTPEQLADQYVREKFQTLAVTMGSQEDSIQTGLRLYNDGKPAEALVQFETIVNRDNSSFEAKKYAGIVSLRLKNYDKAISYFTRMENDANIYANPGKFYHGITLLERRLPGDKEEAKKIMEQVVQNGLEGKETAQLLLNKW